MRTPRWPARVLAGLVVVLPTSYGGLADSLLLRAKARTLANSQGPVAAVSLAEAARFWARLGMVSFGGRRPRSPCFSTNWWGGGAGYLSAVFCMPCRFVCCCRVLRPPNWQFIWAG